MEERKKIIELLKNGKINSDEAEKLLRALRASYRSHLHNRRVEISCGSDDPRVIKKIIKGHHHGHRPRKIIIKVDGETDFMDCCDW